MSYTRTFVWGEHEDSGITGWLMERMPHFDPVSPDFGMAHDVLEHLDRGCKFSDELQAFGSMLYIRALSGWWYDRGSHHTPAQQMASDLANFLHREDFVVDRVRANKLDDIDDCAEDELAAVIEETAKSVWAEADEEDTLTEDELRLTLIDVAGWMRKGFRRCYHRYHRRSPGEMGAFFESLCGELKPYGKRHPDYGDKLIVSINVEELTHKVRFRTAYGEEY
jgi:hypothetical protein